KKNCPAFGRPPKAGLLFRVSAGGETPRLLLLDRRLGDQPFEPVLELLLVHSLLDLLLRLRELGGTVLVVLADSDQVVAELGLHHIADLSGLEFEGRFLELGNHLALPKLAEIAPLLSAGTAGMLFGEGREIGPAVEFLLQALDLGLFLLLGGVV